MQLYRIYENDRATLVRYANSLTQHKEDAEDLVQQAYVKAILQEELFDTMHPSQVMAWLYQTIRNQSTIP
jgi:RNA polymerase sigma-70 factor, ECF subfamily